MKDFEQEGGIPACSLSSCLDTSLGIVGTDEIEGEASEDGHILCAVTGPISRQVIAEFDVEEPMHAFDSPMTTCGPGDPVDVVCGRTDEVACVEGGAVGMLDTADDLDEGLDAGEARLARIAALRSDPVDLAGGGIGACLDAAVALFDGGLGDDLGVGRAVKIVGDLGFEIGLIALEGEQIVGLVGDDLFGDVDLAAPMASMVTSAPCSCLVSARWSSRSGMAVISLVFSGTLSCARVSRATVA